MKEIQLTQGKVALVDDSDFEWLSQWKWCAVRFPRKRRDLFYVVRSLPREGKGEKQRLRYMHHDVLGDAPDNMERDHINGNGLDNQRSNLRFVTRRQNIQNLHITQSSRYPGVTWDKRGRKWMAQANIGGKHKFLGYSRSEKVAFEIYRKAVENLGEEMVEQCLNL